MADAKHVELIRKGSEAIAIWRDANPGNHLDLSGADLRRAELMHANLNGVNLRGAKLEWTDLRWADLIACDLTDALLDRTDLHKADLSNALLTGAKFINTNLEDANLCNADLTAAVFLHARLLTTDLRAVKGLATCTHLGPSTIDLETLEKAGYLPALFLRGCGISDAAIHASYAEDSDALSEALETGSEYYSCFISHSSQDSGFAERLLADLQEKGVRCWFAPKDLKTGEKLLDAVYQAIRQHEKLLLILSEHSIQSWWVEDEVDKAFSEERDRRTTVVFPIRIDNAAMTSAIPWSEKLRNNRQIGDFSNYRSKKAYATATAQLLRDLRKK
jgi:hypothetical protein